MLHEKLLNALPLRYKQYYKEWQHDQTLDEFMAIPWFVCSQDIEKAVQKLNEIDGMIEYYVEHDLATGKYYALTCKNYHRAIKKLKKLLSKHHKVRSIKE